MEIEPSPFLKEPQEELKFVIEKNLKYYDENELQNALCYLDRTCCKTAAVMIKNELMDKIAEMVEDKNKCLSAEERICGNHLVAKTVVPLIFTFAECLWLHFSRMRTSEEIWKVIWFLESFTKELIGNGPVKKYPDGDNDLLGYEYFGDEDDYLVNATCDIIRRSGYFGDLGLSRELTNMIYSGYPDRKKFIPKLKKQDIEINDNLKQQFLFCVFKSMTEAANLLKSANSQGEEY